MNRIIRLRRVAILCCYFARNCSYYRAGWIDKKSSKANNLFWITIQSNFLDIAIMEWMKLFGNNRDQHHWKNIVTEPNSFKANMLQHCALTSDEFDRYHKEMKSYRDKFIAHLDSELIMQVPDLTNAINTTEYYFSYIYNELDDISKIGYPQNLSGYYDSCFLESKNYFDQL